MIKLIEVLRVNKPIAIEVEWDEIAHDVLEVTSILLNGKEIYISEHRPNAMYYLFSGKLDLLPDDNRYQSILIHLDYEDIKYEKISLSSNRISISPEYFQILNPR